MTSIRKAKKQKILNFRELGYRLRWRTPVSEVPHKTQKEVLDWYDAIIAEFERGGMLVCGGFGQNDGCHDSDLIIWKTAAAISPQELESVLVKLQPLLVQNIETLGPFDINKEKEYPLFPGETE